MEIYKRKEMLKQKNEKNKIILCWYADVRNSYGQEFQKARAMKIK